MEVIAHAKAEGKALHVEAEAKAVIELTASTSLGVGEGRRRRGIFLESISAAKYHDIALRIDLTPPV